MGIRLAAPPERVRRCRLIVEGLVQGIGFRPFVQRLATRLDLHGTVRNDRRGVVIEVEGAADAVERFVDVLRSGSAPRLDTAPGRVAVQWQPLRFDRGGFRIEPPKHGGETRVHPAPDVATCAACLRELGDPGDRRYGYALVTCTACGPRYTITTDLPWTRDLTTMAAFAPCPACAAEYGDHEARRFHAETIACAVCGPRLIVVRPASQAPDVRDPIRVAADALAAGRIVAIKGIGGYHLACDATNDAAVRELRRRKRRDARPFAVMLADLDAVQAACVLSDAEAALLSSPARPIVLLRRRDDAAVEIAPAVAPRLRELGVMLPYAPLHHLLFDRVARPLVMTSANTTDEPIVHDDTVARARLAAAADVMISHDRPIHARADDSVARVVCGAPMLLRRARGYVPLAVRLPVTAGAAILACGGELKSVFAMVRDADAFLSPHLGDLSDERAWHAYRDTVGHFERLLGFEPRVVAHDLHPAYRTTAWASGLAGVERVGIQHHHAHVASCLADNGDDGRVLGVAWDGTGYGPDGTVWGGEFLLADLDGFERVGHLETVPMPGGDAAVRQPWRMAGALLMAAYGERMPGLDIDAVRRLDRAGWRALAAAVERGINAPPTSSAGRLFDGIASLLGVRDAVTFEGQAAMELEALADGEPDAPYPAALHTIDDRIVVRTTDLVCAVVEDILGDVPAALIAGRFHATLADIIARVARHMRERRGIARTALSGGVFQNVRLLERTIAVLESDGFGVLRHRHVPPNDGGLALGQAAIAARWLARRTG